jgi:hypothetical protein
MSASPTVNLQNFAGSQIELISGSSQQFTQLLIDFAGVNTVSVLKPLLPFSVIVKNNTGSTLESITLLFTLKDQGGGVVVDTGQYKVIGSGVRPGEMVLMTPMSGLSKHMLHLEGQTSPKLENTDLLASEVASKAKRYLQRAEVTISLDSVIFQDNTINGPDLAEKHSEMNSERRILREIAGELLNRAPEEQSKYLTTIVNDSRAQAAMAQEPWGQRHRLAGMFLGAIAATRGQPGLFHSSLKDTLQRNREIRRRNQ